MANRKAKRICNSCGKESFVELRHGKVRSERCRLCALKARRGPVNPLWKGGYYKKGQYILVWIDPSSIYRAMADKDSYVREHRLVVAQSLGRCLTKREVVHHINGDKSDNRLENLQLISQADHNIKTKLCATCELRKQNRLLKRQIKQQSEQIRFLSLKTIEK